MASSISNAEIVALLEADVPVSDISDENEESEPDFIGNHTDSDTDGENDKQDDCNLHNKIQTQCANAKWLPVDVLYVPQKFKFTAYSRPKKGAFVVF